MVKMSQNESKMSQNESKWVKNEIGPIVIFSRVIRKCGNGMFAIYTKKLTQI